jgi:predicted ATP-grasp superfamily ATP-dependent carboligase
VGSGASGGTSAAGGAPAPAQTGGGVYRVVASLERDQVEPGELERFRRGYSVSANVVTRSGRILELAWNYMAEKLKK